MLRLSSLLFILLTLVATFVGFSIAASDDAAKLLSLEVLKPMADRMVAAGEIFALRGAENLQAVLFAMLAVVIVTGFRFCRPRRNFFVLGIALALVAQVSLISTELAFRLSNQVIQSVPDMTGVTLVYAIGAALYAASLLCLVIAFWRDDPMAAVVERSKADKGFSIRDALLLFAIALVALFFRLYAINQVFNYFEGELACFSAGGTSFTGLFLANKGVAGAWAPLGLLYYFPIYLTTKLFGTTLAALRMSSALVGVLTIPFMYMLGHRIGGKQMGFIAAMLLALNTLHIGWGRTDIHPHGVTTWPSLLLCWLLLRAHDSRKMIDAIFVALAMGLTWHQYPSGQSAVAIPIFAIGTYFILNWFRFPLRWTQLPWIAVGVGLWFIGLPLSYYYPEGLWDVRNPFNLTGPRATWGGVQGEATTIEVALMVTQKSYEQLFDVLQGIFYKVPYLFHQDFLPYLPNFNTRSVAWAIAAFGVVGLFIVLRSLKRFECAVLLAWMTAAILPGIMSEHAYPKRLSTLFPAIDMLAALALTRFVLYLRETGQSWRRWLANSALLVAFAGFVLFQSNVWFSGREWKYGEPPEVAAAEEMAKEIKPKTIIIADLVLGYHIGKMTYMLLDPLTDPKNRPNLWFAQMPHAIPMAIKEPLKASELNSDWVYMWTKLRDQKAETDEFKGWERVVFMIQERTQPPDDNKAEIESVINRCNNPVVRRIENKGSFWLPMVIVSCNVSDLK